MLKRESGPSFFLFSLSLSQFASDSRKKRQDFLISNPAPKCRIVHSTVHWTVRSYMVHKCMQRASIFSPFLGRAEVKRCYKLHTCCTYVQLNRIGGVEKRLGSDGDFSICSTQSCIRLRTVPIFLMHRNRILKVSFLLFSILYQLIKHILSDLPGKLCILAHALTMSMME